MKNGDSKSVPRPCVCTTIRTVSRHLARVYDEALQTCELNVTQLAVLRAIDRMEGEALSRIADSLSMERTSMYRAVSTMERNGWVKVNRGKDARSRSAVLCPTGHRMLDRASPYWDGIQSKIVNQFGRDRWQALVAEIQELKKTADIVESERLSQGHEEQTP